MVYDSGVNWQPRFLFAVLFLLGAVVIAQTAQFDGRPAVVLENDKLQLSVLIRGATLANLILRGDADKLSPYWNTDRALNPNGPLTAPLAGAIGHFLCLDGFGAPSAEEAAAGIPFHGEASKQPFETASTTATTITLKTRLPLAQEDITRTITLLDGENVVYVNTEVENLLAIDHPISWAEHATTGPPFLSPGNTVIDLPATKCRVRPQKAGSTGKLAYGKDFVWPMGPLTKGGNVNLTTVPVNEASLDLASCIIDPARTYGYVTALRTDKHMIFGYVFRREEFPWIMSWMNYTGDARAARGFEFSTQPFDISHRETVDAHEMFGTPTYKWLPAKAKLQGSFLLFYSKAPEGFESVADLKLEGGQIRIIDKSSRVITLKASRSL